MPNFAQVCQTAVTVAAIDRLVHHSNIIEINTDSYRRRAAAFTAAPASAQMSGFKSLNPATTANTMIHKTGRNGRRIAGAIALGLIGAAVIAGNARASHYDGGYSRHDRRCNKWRRWCRDGEDRACWKYDNRC